MTAFHHGGRAVTYEDLLPYLTKKQKELLGGDEKIESVNTQFKTGLLRLMVGFFFRLSDGARSSVFEFTHKSFGEYLAARRMIFGMLMIFEEWTRFRNAPESTSRRGRTQTQGWDMDESLVEWIRLFGPTQLTQGVIRFFRSELLRVEIDKDNKTTNPVCEAERLPEIREMLLWLLHHIQRHGLPMHTVDADVTFHEMQIQSRHAEEAIFVLHRAICSSVQAHDLEVVPLIGPADAVKTNRCPIWEGKTEFGSQLVRIVGQRDYSQQNPVLASLSLFDFHDANLSDADLSGADLIRANLSDANLSEADLRGADLSGANLKKGILSDEQLKSIFGTPDWIKEETNNE